jgi:hypothetical protein
MPRIISTGELKGILREHAENPDEGAGFVYRRIPKSISGHTWGSLSEHDRALYVADPDSVIFDSKLPGEPLGERVGRYTRFVLPPGSYDAWMVSR